MEKDNSRIDLRIRYQMEGEHVEIDKSGVIDCPNGDKAICAYQIMRHCLDIPKGEMPIFILAIASVYTKDVNNGLVKEEQVIDLTELKNLLEEDS